MKINQNSYQIEESNERNEASITSIVSEESETIYLNGLNYSDNESNPTPIAYSETDSINEFFNKREQNLLQAKPIIAVKSSSDQSNQSNFLDFIAQNYSNSNQNHDTPNDATSIDNQTNILSNPTATVSNSGASVKDAIDTVENVTNLNEDTTNTSTGSNPTINPRIANEPTLSQSPTTPGVVSINNYKKSDVESTFSSQEKEPEATSIKSLPKQNNNSTEKSLSLFKKDKSDLLGKIKMDLSIEYDENKCKITRATNSNALEVVINRRRSKEKGNRSYSCSSALPKSSDFKTSLLEQKQYLIYNIANLSKRKKSI